ncbi:MAG: hypothetical protein K2J64_07845, partial [Desulfovibrio sp.]|nr:hypothetical protein [Desulfovibrio sp.]
EAGASINISGDNGNDHISLGSPVWPIPDSSGGAPSNGSSAANGEEDADAEAVTLEQIHARRKHEAEYAEELEDRRREEAAHIDRLHRQRYENALYARGRNGRKAQMTGIFRGARELGAV